MRRVLLTLKREIAGLLLSFLPRTLTVPSTSSIFAFVLAYMCSARGNDVSYRLTYVRQLHLMGQEANRQTNFEVNHFRKKSCLLDTRCEQYHAL
jgi:hypothetical protein